MEGDEKNRRPSKASRRKASLFDACRKACAARPRPSARAGGTARIDIVERPPRSMGVFMICLGLFIVAFCAFAVVYAGSGALDGTAERAENRKATETEGEPPVGKGKEGMDAALLGSLILGPAGIALAIGGAASLYRRERLRITNDRLTWERRAFTRSGGFTESLASYVCVLPESALLGGRHSETRILFFGRLVHRREDAKCVALRVHSLEQLAVLTGQGSERLPLEALARSLDLPLASVSADGSVAIRYPDELDLTIADRQDRRPGRSGLSDTRGSLADSPAGIESCGPGRPCPKGRYRIREVQGGFTAARGYPVYWLPFAVLASAGGLYLRFAPAGGKGYTFLLVIGLFALFMLAFALTRARLTVDRQGVEAAFTIAGIVARRQVIPLNLIEEIDIVKDPRYRNGILKIASDDVTIYWGQGDSPEIRVWFKEAILAAIRGGSTDKTSGNPDRPEGSSG